MVSLYYILIAMEPDMIIIPHILLRAGDTIKIPQPQWGDILAKVLWVDWWILRVEVEWRAFVFHWGFFVEQKDGTYLPYMMNG